MLYKGHTVAAVAATSPHIAVANPSHPFGVRGVGETCIIPPLAAVANAIYRATGVRFQRLPMSPGRILEALWANGKGK